MTFNGTWMWGMGWYHKTSTDRFQKRSHWSRPLQSTVIDVSRTPSTTFELGSCESFFSVRIESRIESAVRFDFKSNFRIESAVYTTQAVTPSNVCFKLADRSFSLRERVVGWGGLQAPSVITAHKFWKPTPAAVSNGLPSATTNLRTSRS